MFILKIRYKSVYLVDDKFIIGNKVSGYNVKVLLVSRILNFIKMMMMLPFRVLIFFRIYPCIYIWWFLGWWYLKLLSWFKSFLFSSHSKSFSMSSLIDTFEPRWLFRYFWSLSWRSRSSKFTMLIFICMFAMLIVTSRSKDNSSLQSVELSFFIPYTVIVRQKLLINCIGKI